MDSDKPEELKIWFAIRSDLSMSSGKIAIQCAHAAVGLVKLHMAAESSWSRFEEYEAHNSPKIAVRIGSEKELDRVVEECKYRLLSYVVRDAGRSEVEPGTPTVVAFGPTYRSKLPPFLKRLQLWEE